MSENQQYEGDFAAEDQSYDYAEGGYGESDNFQQDGGQNSSQSDSQQNGAGNSSDKDKSEEESHIQAHKIRRSPPCRCKNPGRISGVRATSRKLFVGGISWDTEPKDLKEYFGKFGEITNVNIKTDPNTGKCRGFGFVTFQTQEGVESALAQSQHMIKGKQIDPKRAKARPGIKKIFVGGLESDIPEADIRSYFEKYGKIENIELPFDKVKNQRRQFCFITFETEEAVDEVCKQPKQRIGNKDCDIKKAAPKPDPRSMRGGFGGGGRGGRGGDRGGYGSTYGQGYGGYGQGYGNSGYGGGYDGSYDYSGWNNYQAGGGNYGGGYSQPSTGYGGRGRRGGGYHPYSR